MLVSVKRSSRITYSLVGIEIVQFQTKIQAKRISSVSEGFKHISLLQHFRFGTCCSLWVLNACLCNRILKCRYPNSDKTVDYVILTHLLFNFLELTVVVKFSPPLNFTGHSWTGPLWRRRHQNEFLGQVKFRGG